MSAPDDDDDDRDLDDPDLPYVKETIKLSASHRWKASPGHNILVLDAGAVRLEYPTSWRVIPKSNRLQIHDRQPPDDEGRFQITVFRLPKLKDRSWDEVPLDELLHNAITTEPQKRRHRKSFERRALLKDVTTIRRPDLEYVWAETTAPDPKNGRTILTRQVLARARGVQPLITFDYYAAREEDYVPVWQHTMNSLRLGTPVNLLGDINN
jgi:hypothetical protein